MNSQANRLLATLSFLGLLVATAPAQSMTVTPGNAVEAGDVVKVTYSDPSKANQTIVVRVSNNEQPPNNEEENLFITLDGHGTGMGQWTAPESWDSATFTAPGVVEVTLVIGPADTESAGPRVAEATLVRGPLHADPGVSPASSPTGA